MPIIKQNMLQPGVWLKSTGRKLRIRDGVGKQAPSKDVGPIDPVWFDNLSRAQMAGNQEVFVLEMAPPDGHASGDDETRAAELNAMREALLDAQAKNAELMARNAELEAVGGRKAKS